MKTIRQIIQECLDGKITIDEAVFQIENNSAGEYYLIHPSTKEDIKLIINWVKLEAPDNSRVLSLAQNIELH